MAAIKNILFVGSRKAGSAAQGPAASSVAISDPSFGVPATGSYTYSGGNAEKLAPPSVDRINITGTLISGNNLTATLNGIIGDVLIGTCTWRIYRANDIQQSGEVLATTITNQAGNALVYALLVADEQKYLRIECDIKGANGEVGETLSSDYSSAIAAPTPPFGNVVWQNIANTSAVGNTVTHSSTGAASARSVQIIPSNTDFEVTFDWDSASRENNSDLIIGIIVTSDTNVRANVPIHTAIRANNFNLDHFENGTYKASTSFRQQDGSTYTTMRYKIKRISGLLTFESSGNGLPYVGCYTRTGGVVNGAMQMVFLDALTTTGLKCVNATINTIP